ncbi:MAG: hypothetical protein ACI4FZ_05285, partial [Lachnospiraceae bacterium]
KDFSELAGAKTNLPFKAVWRKLRIDRKIEKVYTYTSMEFFTLLLQKGKVFLWKKSEQDTPRARQERCMWAI